MKSLTFYVWVFFAFCFALSCDKDESKEYTITGRAQKGPFYSGANVTVAELDKFLLPTGRVFLSTTTDNQGSFSIPHVSLKSNYVQIKVEGMYYHEGLGAGVSPGITLFAVADVSQSTNINVNLFTHIEKDRLEYLVQKGKSFSEAKKQVSNEILKTFNFEGFNWQLPENQDLTLQGEANSVLLATTSIILGNSLGVELLDLLTNIRTDLKEDGVINSEATKTILATNASMLDTRAIGDNLEKWFKDMGIDVTIPDFSKYITHFKENTKYVSVFEKALPKTTANGLNLVNLADSSIIKVNTPYTIALDLANSFFRMLVILENIEPGLVVTENNKWLSAADSIFVTELNSSTVSSIDIPVKFSRKGKIQLRYQLLSLFYGEKIQIKTYFIQE